MYHTKIRDSTNKVVIYYHNKNSIVDLTPTSNYEHFSVDTIDYEEHVVKKNQIDTDKPSPSDVEPIYTSKTLTIAALPVSAKIAPVEIATGAPIDKEKIPFRPVATTVI